MPNHILLNDLTMKPGIIKDTDSRELIAYLKVRKIKMQLVNWIYKIKTLKQKAQNTPEWMREKWGFCKTDPKRLYITCPNWPTHGKSAPHAHTNIPHFGRAFYLRYFYIPSRCGGSCSNSKCQCCGCCGTSIFNIY